MFKKIGSFEEEIYSSMKKELVSNQLENKYSFDKISKAADYINSAAELLDDTGFSVEADMLTKVLKRLANEQDAVDSNEAHPKEEVPEEIILEPLDQELETEPMMFHPNEILDGEVMEKPEFLQFRSIAEVAARLIAKKKV